MKQKRRIITDKKIEFFRAELLREEKTANTVEKYVRDINKFKDYCDGKNINQKLVLAYKSWLQECGRYRISSINSYLVVLNHFCKVMGWGELCVKTIKIQETAFEMEEKELTMAEYKKLIHTAMEAGDERTAMILQTIGSTGIRISELKYIRVEAFADGFVDVHNKAKVRRILLPYALMKVLKEYAKRNHIKNGVLFYNERKQPLDRKNIWRHMKRIARMAGIPETKVYPHNLRHLFAKEFYKQTGDIMKLADILGHSNVNTTRIYIRTSGREHKQLLDEMHMVLQNSPHIEKEYVQPHTKAESRHLQLSYEMLEQDTMKTDMSGKMYEIRIQIPIPEVARTSTAGNEVGDIIDIMSHFQINNL